MLQARIETLVGIQVGAVARYVKHFHLLDVLGQPRLHRLAVVHAQVVQNQEHLARASLISASKNSISRSQLNALSVIIHGIA